MAGTEECVHAHNKMRDCFQQDMVNDRLYSRKHNHEVFCVSIITEQGKRIADYVLDLCCCK